MQDKLGMVEIEERELLDFPTKYEFLIESGTSLYDLCKFKAILNEFIRRKEEEIKGWPVSFPFNASYEIESKKSTDFSFLFERYKK